MGYCDPQLKAQTRTLNQPTPKKQPGSTRATRVPSPSEGPVFPA
jgi:hypothetical protein